MKILFYGDSITDAGRDRTDPHNLGPGYPAKIAEWLAINQLEKTFEVINRGIGGDRTNELLERIEEDCLDEKPDLVSLLVGINDTWHNLEGKTFATAEEAHRFEVNYRSLVDQILQLGKPLIILEPYLLPHPKERLQWRVDLDSKIQIIRQIALEHHLPFVPLDGILHSYAVDLGCQAITGEDGVHPTDLGFELITKAWLDVAIRHHLI